MAAREDDEEERCSKKLRIDSDALSESIHESLSTFGGFSVTRILNENAMNKLITVEGRFVGDERPAVILLEKQPFDKNELGQMMSKSTTLTRQFHNDIYGSYHGFPEMEINGIKATIIHPASEKHVEKYSEQSLRMITETAEVYRNITLPYLLTTQFSLQWVFNILEHKSEADRIIYENPDPEMGFVLIPDLKWDGIRKENLYLMALCHRKDLRSLRDLTAAHIPFLKNLKKKCLKAIEEKYEVHSSQLRIYLHYQPSYYHLHVHFTILKFDAPGTKVERAHLLETVISNLELMPDYYKKITLCYVVKETDVLYKKFLEYNKISSDGLQ